MDKVNEKTLREIKNATFRKLPAKMRNTANLHILNEVLPSGSSINAGHQKIAIRKPTIAVFIDEEPLANWSHKCRYLLHEAESGVLYSETKAGFPPFLVEPPNTFTAFHEPVVAQNPMQKIWSIREEIHFPLRLRDGRRYAILFSGASNNRHVNDMEFLYRQLVDRFYFNEADITVLNLDGSLNYVGGPKPVVNWPGDGSPYTMPVHGPGTKAAFENAIDNLKAKLKQNDLLLIHTNNHGGHNGTESYLCTNSAPNYYASEFANKLAQLPAFDDLIVMMEQCHSGGFNDLVIESSTATRTTFSAACTEGKNSIGGADFDPFARDWIAALAGSDPYGAPLLSNPDYDSSGRVSSREAFAYADDIHHSYDSPVYSAYGVNAGDQNLYQKWRVIHIHHDLILEELAILRDKLGDPILYRRAMREVVAPKLVEMDDRFFAGAVDPREAKSEISKLIRSTAEGKSIRELEAAH